MQLLSGQDIQRIEAHLRRRLPEVLRRLNIDPLRDAIRDYVFRGGKRIRPQLVQWTFGHCTDRTDRDPAVMELACAWEVFHAFLLVHDDIIDAADHRREQPALHRQLAALDSNCPRFGANLGIVAGDLLFTAAMRIWHELDLPPAAYRAELKLFDRVAELTGIGQAIDIVQGHVPLGECDEQTLLDEYCLKTAVYTFEGPMLSAAIAAELEQPALDAISGFALALGQAYQLHNDVLDLRAPLHAGSDLVQGKRTITLLRHRASLDASARLDFDARFAHVAGGGRCPIEMAAPIREELLNSGADTRTDELIVKLLETADSHARRDALPGSLSKALLGLLATLRDNYFRVGTRSFGT